MLQEFHAPTSFPDALIGSWTYHEVSPEHQGHDLRLGGRVAVVVAGQVPAAAPARPVLPVVLGAQHPVQAEQQQHQQHARGQAQGSHPAGDTHKDHKVRKSIPVSSPGLLTCWCEFLS